MKNSDSLYTLPVFTQCYVGCEKTQIVVRKIITDTIPFECSCYAHCYESTFTKVFLNHFTQMIYYTLECAVPLSFWKIWDERTKTEFNVLVYMYTSRTYVCLRVSHRAFFCYFLFKPVITRLESEKESILVDVSHFRHGNTDFSWLSYFPWNSGGVVIQR